MSKHTPGPWVACNNNGYSIWRVTSPVYRANSASRTIAEVVGDSAETEANARLITAAPDLLEAAIVQQECGSPSTVILYDEDGCEGWLWRHPDGREWAEIGDWSEPPTLHPLMKAAIAKAEGGKNE